jgi:hypothetical protein
MHKFRLLIVGISASGALFAGINVGTANAAPFPPCNAANEGIIITGNPNFECRRQSDGSLVWTERTANDPIPPNSDRDPQW